MKTTKSKLFNSKYLKTFAIILIMVMSIALFAGVANASLDCFHDDDGDGYGDDPCNCNHPKAVEYGGDCDDTDPDEHPNQTWYKDTDNDGYYDGTTDTTSCERPVGYKVLGELISTVLDCDDTDEDINPGESEICNNSVDEDCSGYDDDIIVDCNGNGDYTTIQAGIDATDGTCFDTVLVYPCTYTENIDFKGYDITVISRDGAATTTIDGSAKNHYQGTDYASVVYFKTSETLAAILDGFTIINGSGTTSGSDTLGGGIYISGASPTIKNCIIGNSVNDNDATEGGGIYISGADLSPTIETCTISYNDATDGAGIFLTGADSSPFIDTCTIRYNIATFRGGGFYASDYGSPVIKDCTISYNEGTFGGGGIYSAAEAIDVYGNTVVSHNSAPNGYGGGIYFSAMSRDYTPTLTDITISYNTAKTGGGLSIHAHTGYMGQASIITGCTIENNTATEGGGGFYITGSYLSYNDIIDCTIENNSTDGEDGGGGLWCWYGAPHITRCTITGNEAASYGGGIYASQAGPVIKGGTVSGNTAFWGGGIVTYKTYSSSPIIERVTIDGNTSSYGGGLYIKNGSAPIVVNSLITNNTGTGASGGIHINDDSPEIINTTIADNTSGILCSGSLSPFVLNSILWNNNNNEITLGPGSSINIAYSDVDMHATGGPPGIPPVVWPGTGNIYAVPGFVSDTYDDYDIDSDSPCKDTGIDEYTWTDPDPDVTLTAPSDDIHRVSRPYNTYYDMGAHEYAP
jgi:parallel beta-helix repeat protein